MSTGRQWDEVRADGPIANQPTSGSDLESIPVRCRLRTETCLVVRVLACKLAALEFAP